MKGIGILLLVGIALAITGCTGIKEAAFERGTDLFLANKLKDASKLLEASVTLMPDNAEAHAWYAECLRRMGEYDRAAEIAYAALEIEPEHAFAHTVLADLFNPMYSTWSRVNADSSWFHILAAVKSDPNDGNAWLSLWPQAIMRGDRDLEIKADTVLIASGFLTGPVLAYNRWMLRDLPKDAILITNGDFDTFPAVALQTSEDFRQDVAICNLSLLNVNSYVLAIARRYSLPLPFDEATLENLKAYRSEDGTVVTPGAQIIRGWFEMLQTGRLKRPLCVATTVRVRRLIPDSEKHAVLCGAYYEMRPEEVEPIDLEQVAQSLTGLEISDFEGSFFSDSDRSPVRRTTANNLGVNLTALMLRYAAALIDRGERQRALPILEMAREFDDRLAAGGQFKARIDSLTQLE